MNDQLFQVVVFPGRDRGPRAALFRIVVVGDGPGSHAWILLRSSEQPVIDFTRAHDERDAALNALLERKLSGVRVDRLRLVIAQSHEYVTYPIEIDVHDYEARGNPVHREDIGVPTGESRETSIRAEDVIAGRTRVLTSDRNARALADSERISLSL